MIKIHPDAPLVSVNNDVHFSFVGCGCYAADDTRGKPQTLQPVLDFETSLTGSLEILPLNLEFGNHKWGFLILQEVY
jgi:hypothetical protein